MEYCVLDSDLSLLSIQIDGFASHAVFYAYYDTFYNKDVFLKK